jgi:hypothetical protein
MGSIEALAAAIEQHVAAIRATAWNAPAGGGSSWDTLLRHYGILPLHADERAFLASHMKLSRGAVPAEVRIALAGLEGWARSELAKLTASAPAARAALEARLAGLVAGETAAYEHALGIPPPTPAMPVASEGPSLASIFANAHDTAKDAPWANVTAKAVQSLTCVHCGGPQEAPLDFVCRYCRRPIAGPASPFRPTP